jgi:hypothetical protein
MQKWRTVTNHSQRTLLTVYSLSPLRASLDGKARGIRWKLTETLEDLHYADDICLFSHSQAHMQSKLNNLRSESKKAGLEFNFSKTEELRVITKSQRSIMLANKAIRRVHDFTYLGSNVSEDGGIRKDVEIRIKSPEKLVLDCGKYGWYIM